MDKYIEYFSCRDAFYNAVLDILSGDSNNDRANQIIDLFDNLPTADVQLVTHAEWICHEPEIGLYYSCSRCGHNALQGMYKFCPNCGAKMDESEDDKHE